jgi:hypothetical protein
VVIAVLANDSDPDGDPLTVTALTQPANGTAVLNPDGTVTYTPDPDFVGEDSFTYRASDGSLESAPATVTVTVSAPPPVNNPPLAGDDGASTTQGAAVVIAVLANDSDPDGDPLTVTALTQPANGTAVLNPDGTVTYTPDPDFVGEDSFTYRASDGSLESAPATVTVTVSAPEGGEPALPSILNFQQGVAGYAGTIDTYLHQASPGTVRRTAKELIVDGVDKGGEVQALLRFDDIFGAGPGRIPLGAIIGSATLELATTNKGDGASIHRMVGAWSDTDTWTSLGNGIQADGVEAMMQADLITGFVPIGTTTLDVTASLQAWANGQTNLGWAFLPLGSDGWKFNSAEGTVAPKLTVEFRFDGGRVNNPPVAGDDSASTMQGNAVVIPVLANDSDPDGDQLTVTALTQPANGTAVLNPDGTITYTPNAGFIGADIFTYRAFDGGLLSDPATVVVTVTVPDGPPLVPLETSYIATLVNSGTDKRNMEHTNATKSFYHDGDWWSVLPNQQGWHVHRFDGPLPEPGTLGGWTAAGPTMMSPGRRADIAWDVATQTLYVLNFGPSETTPRLYKLGYDDTSRSFDIIANIQLAGTNGKLTGAEWQRNPEMSLGLDQNGIPIVALIGPSAAGGTKGLKLAFPTSPDLETWSTTVVDGGPTTATGSNGDNKADIVAFRQDGVDRIGIAYSDEATKTWKFAYQDTPAAPGGYASGWITGTITGAVGIDNHIAALWDGTSIIVTMKDDKNGIWAVKGLPDAWETPVSVHDRSHNASRPTLAYDQDNGNVFVFFQENTNRPYGDIHVKVASADDLAFNASDPGIRIVASTRAGENMTDPQMPTHPVGAATEGKFFVFARNWDQPEVWYNDIILADEMLFA